MKAMIPRIHSVRLKSGGAKLKIINLAPRKANSDELLCTLQWDAGGIWGEFDGCVAGFALVVWSSGGDTASRVYNTAFSQVPNAVIPSLTEECARRALTSVQINRKLGHDDDDGVA